MSSNVREWLAESKKRGMELGLERIFRAHQALLESPYQSTILHVAGSNGKGTLCATLAVHLNHLGKSTVMFTSPHLVRVEERIRINGQPIDAHTFDQCLLQIQAVELELDLNLTFFEITFLVACLFAHREQATFFIVETGLGGRYDATRILPADAAIITSLSLEHRDILGDTLAKISAEKAAIARPGKPLFVRQINDGDAISAIEFEATNAGRKELGEAFGPAPLSWIEIPDEASFQQEAALLAKAVLAWFNLNTDGLEASVRNLRWPGRLQEIPTEWETSMLVDAAHNPSGLARILPQLNDRIEQLPDWTLVFGCTPQYDLQAFSQPLVDFCHRHPPQNIVLTKPQHGRYSGVPINALQELDWPKGCEIHACEDAEASYRLLMERRPTFTIVIGSLYLVGEMYEAMGLLGSEHMEMFPAKAQRDEV